MNILKSKFFYFAFLLLVGSATSVYATSNDDDKTIIVHPESNRIRYKPLLSEIENIMSRRHPQYFTGFDKIDPLVVSAIRRPRGDNNDPLFNLLHHVPRLVPMIEALRTEIGDLPTTDKIKKNLLAEIDFKLNTDQVSPAWATIFHFRIAALKMMPSDEERDLFNHAVNPRIFRGLFGVNESASELVLVYNIYQEYDENDGRMSSSYTTNNIHFRMVDKIERRLANEQPANIIYPMPKVGIIGIACLVGLILDDIHGIGFPDERIKAHSALMSPGGFAIHDFLHSQVDPRKRIFLNVVLGLMDRYVGQGGDANVFLEVFAPLVAKYYVMLMNSLKLVYEASLTDLLVKDEERFKKVMAGMFLSLHEYPVFSEKSFNQKSLINVIHELSENTIKAINLDISMSAEKDSAEQEIVERFKERLINDDSVWNLRSNTSEKSLSGEEIISELLETDDISFNISLSSTRRDYVVEILQGTELKASICRRVDGHEWKMSALSIDPGAIVELSDDDRALLITEAKKFAAKNYVLQIPQQYYTDLRTAREERERKAKLELIKATDVKSSPHFVDVTFTLRTGQKKRYSVSLLAQKWSNADDYLGLLNFAGIAIEKPDITGLDEEQKVASMEATFAQMKKGLSELVREYEHFALEVFEAPRRGANLAQRYEQKKRELVEVFTFLLGNLEKNRQRK